MVILGNRFDSRIEHQPGKKMRVAPSDDHRSDNFWEHVPGWSTLLQLQMSPSTGHIRMCHTAGRSGVE